MKNIGYLYFPGLNNEECNNVMPRLHERLMQRYWKSADMELEYVPIGWLSSYDEIISIATKKVESMANQFDGVALIGASAGASLALNVFTEMSDKNIALIAMHGRLSEGNYLQSDRRSLESAANLGSSYPAHSFYDSVRLAELTIANLTDDEKHRMLILKQLTDRVVPLELMDIVGIKSHRSIAFGHIGGFVAHAFADRDIIRHFAEKTLL